MLENFIYSTPLFVLLCGIMALLFDEHSEEEDKQCFKFSRIMLFISFFFAIIFYNKPPIVNISKSGNFILFFHILLYTVGFLLLSLSRRWFASMKMPAHVFCGGLFIAISAAYLLISSDNLALTFISIFLMTIGNYVLFKNITVSKEINYLTKWYFIGMMVCALLFITLLIWIDSKHILFNYADLKQFIINNLENPQIYLFYCSLLLIFAFVLFLAPLHFLLTEILGKAALPVATYFILIPNIAGLAGFINLHIQVLLPLTHKFNIFAQSFAVFSIFIGAIGACSVQNLRKIIAYVTIFHIGTVFMLLQNSTLPSTYAALLYFLIVFICLCGLCCCLFALKIKGEYLFMLNDFSGAAQKKPYISVMFAFFLLTLLGLPPLLGFLGNFTVINYLLLYHHWKALAFILIMMVIVSCSYWRILQKIFFDKNEQNYDRTDFGINIFVTILASLSLLIAFKPYVLTAELHKILEQIFE